jgi:hypothetical protein
MVGSTEDDGWDDMEIASLETGKPIKISATGITFKVRVRYAAPHDTDGIARCQLRDSLSASYAYG